MGKDKSQEKRKDSLSFQPLPKIDQLQESGKDVLRSPEMDKIKFQGTVAKER